MEKGADPIYPVPVRNLVSLVTVLTGGVIALFITSLIGFGYTILISCYIPSLNTLFLLTKMFRNVEGLSQALPSNATY